MSINLNDNIYVSAPKPIDERIVKATTTDRDAIPMVERYTGLEVLVTTGFVKYTWNGSAWVLQTTTLAGLSDVNLTSLANNQFLKYNSGTSRWINTLLSTSDIPDLDMSKITTGNLIWGRIVGTPSSLQGYGITDPIVLETGSYANPIWITSLAASKISGLATVATSGSYNDLINKPTYTPGQVLFGSNANGIAQTSNLFYDNTNNRLGVGTATPTKTLEVSGSAMFTGTGGASDPPLTSQVNAVPLFQATIMHTMAIQNVNNYTKKFIFRGISLSGSELADKSITLDLPDTSGTLALVSQLPVYTSSNGLTLSGNNVKLGGILTDASTNIDISARSLVIASNTTPLNQGIISFDGPNANLTIGRTNAGGFVTQAISFPSGGGTRMLVTDNLNAIGFIYGANYAPAGTGNDRWIPDYGAVKTYADTKVPTTRTITINGTTLDLSADRSWTISTGTTYTSSNGITLSGTNFVLGGNLTLNTTLTLTSGTTLSIPHGANSTISLGGGSTSPTYGRLSMNDQGSLLQAGNPATTSSWVFVKPTGGITVGDQTSNIGFTYVSNYATNGILNDRWIPDYGAVKAYSVPLSLTANTTITSNSFNLTVSGNLYAAAFYQTSDLNAKQNVKELDFSIEEVLKLNPVSYEFISQPGITKYGFIAQDVEKLFPNVVSTSSLYKSVEYTQIIPLLVKVVKELKEEIEQLKNK